VSATLPASVGGARGRTLGLGRELRQRGERARRDQQGEQRRAPTSSRHSGCLGRGLAERGAAACGRRGGGGLARAAARRRGARGGRRRPPAAGRTRVAGRVRGRRSGEEGRRRSSAATFPCSPAALWAIRAVHQPPASWRGPTPRVCCCCAYRHAGTVVRAPSRRPRGAGGRRSAVADFARGGDVSRRTRCARGGRHTRPGGGGGGGGGGGVCVRVCGVRRPLDGRSALGEAPTRRLRRRAAAAVASSRGVGVCLSAQARRLIHPDSTPRPPRADY